MSWKLILAALALSAAALAVAVGFMRHRPARGSGASLASEPLLAALSAAKQPASTLAAVRRAAQLGEPCRYAELATRAALDADLPSFALNALDQAPPACSGGALRNGQRAEALARTEADAEAERLAHSALAANARDPHAELALAQVSYEKNQMGPCSEHAQKALQFGRGVEAERLLARADLARGRYSEAEAHYRALSRSNADDVEAAFSGAVCNDKLGRYHAAREGFLHTLRINPQHAEARKYLVVLTYNAGAKEEARHHLTKLSEIPAQDSALLGELESLLRGEPSKSAQASAPNQAQP